MGHAVQALIILEAAVAAANTALEHTRAVPIGKGLSIVPITDETFDALRARFPNVEDPSAPEFYKLSGPIMIVARQLSVFGPVAYIETDYFGGTGSQSAMVWSQGEITMPPTQSDGGPINRALRLLGVRAGLTQDEFDAVGLGRNRSNDQWLEDFP
jgi:hypothetical protein